MYPASTSWDYSFHACISRGWNTGRVSPPLRNFRLAANRRIIFPRVVAIALLAVIRCHCVPRTYARLERSTLIPS